MSVTERATTLLKRSLLLSTAVFSFVIPTATAQDVGAQASDDDFGIEEIIVRSRRRDERLQDVPDQITVFTERQIVTSGIEDFSDFANLTSNFTVFESFRPGVTFLTMRGIPTAQGGEPPVTIVVDGIQVAGLDFVNQSLFDVEKIEVLKGPQGALYGRGAIAGAILITTRQPTNEFRGRAKISYGRNNDFRASAGVSGPIVEDKLFFRVAVGHINRDGLIPIEFLGIGADFQEDTTVSGKLRFMPTENLTFEIRGKRERGEFGGTPAEIVGDANFMDFSIYPDKDIITFDDRSIDELSGIIEWTTAYGTLTSATSYQDSLSTFTGDDVASGRLDIAMQFNQVSVESFNQDIHFTSNDDERFRWVAGFYYQDRDTVNFLDVRATLTTQILPPGLILAVGDQLDISKAWAIYGQGSYDVTEELELTVALRYDEDKRNSEDRLVPDSLITQTFEQLQPKVSLAYNWAEDVMTYASYGRGFRSGGFNALRDSQQIPSVTREFPKEISDNFEVGLKTTFAGGRVVFNAAVFRIDFDNQQFFFVDTTNVSRSIVSINKTRINGAEFELMMRPAAGLFLSASIGIIDADVTNFDGTGKFDGNSSPNTHSYELNLSGQYEFPLAGNFSVVTRIDYEHRGRIFWSTNNNQRWPGVDFVNARLFLEAEHWAFGGFIKNATNEKTAEIFSPDAIGQGRHLRFRNQPRYYGLEVRANF